MEGPSPLPEQAVSAEVAVPSTPPEQQAGPARPSVAEEEEGPSAMLEDEVKMDVAEEGEEPRQESCELKGE